MRVVLLNLRFLLANDVTDEFYRRVLLRVVVEVSLDDADCLPVDLFARVVLTFLESIDSSELFKIYKERFVVITASEGCEACR